MLKIVHLGKFYFPDVGGIEAVTSSLSKGAIVAGHEVTVVCFNKLQENCTDMIDGVRVLRKSVSKIIATQPLSWGYVQASVYEARQSDIVHMHAPNMLAAFCCLLIGKKPRLVVHWHGDILNKGILGPMFKPLETALLKRADSIVATSQVYADTSPSLKPFRSKISIVPIGVPDLPNGFDTEIHLEKLPTSFTQNLKDKFLILAVGRLVPFKGFNVLIEAARHLDDNTIVAIVGDGPKHADLQAAITASGLSDKVYLLGPLSNRLSNGPLHELFKRADLYCLPSVERSESFGVVLIEAMAYGIPCIVSNIPGSGVAWVNQNGISGINVPVGDPVALANACKNILKTPQERIKLSEGARKRFLTEFTEDVSVTRMLKVYDELIRT